MASLHLAQEIFSLIYPVGSIYISTSSTNPNTLFGGTWERVSKGRCLLGVDENNSDTNMKSSNINGGWATHNHSTGGHTLTVDQIPSHTHEYADRMMIWDASGNNSDIVQNGSYNNTCVRFKSWGTTTNARGGGEAHNHGNTGNGTSYPPFYSCYIWRRTA